MGTLRICYLFLTICISQLQSRRDPSSEQLMDYRLSHSSGNRTIILTTFGVPVDDVTSSLRAGNRGPLVLQDTTLTDVMASFNRERIAERVVHAKGAGAFGHFVVTHDITPFCKAALFEKPRKETKVAVRFSSVIGETGSGDSLRDPRGFAVKFYTDEGIWDMVGNNTPIFFIRDPMMFSLFIHSQKRNPVTNLKDRDMFWDFLTQRQESVHQIMRLFSNLGTPDGFRHMNGYGSHTFKMVNKRDEACYVKFHFLTNQGIKNFTAVEASRMESEDPDHATRDLYNAIAEKKFPSWTLCIQVMTFEQAEKLPFNPFDVTKVWPEDEFKLLEVGKMVLDKNPTDYFSEVEQIAFDPGRMTPGIEASPDIMLQARMFGYADAQRHRLGPNYLQIPVNRAFRTRELMNYQRSGSHCIYNQGGAPNYYPNSFGGPTSQIGARIKHFKVSGDVARYNSSDEDNYSQPKLFWKSLCEHDKVHLVENIAQHAKKAAPFLQDRVVTMFATVDANLGARLKYRLKELQSTEPEYDAQVHS